MQNGTYLIVISLLKNCITPLYILSDHELFNAIEFSQSFPVKHLQDVNIFQVRGGGGRPDEGQL